MIKRIEGQEGLFQIEVTMPYGPEELVLPGYKLPGTYGSEDQEEAAARFIIACQEAGGWYAISLWRLYRRWEQESDEFTAALTAAEKARTAALEHNSHEQEIYKLRCETHKIACFFTLGLYRLFGSKPNQPNLQSVPPKPAGVPPHSKQFIWDAMYKLRDRCMIHIVSYGDWDVFVPTPRLLEPISKYRRPAQK